MPDGNCAPKSCDETEMVVEVVVVVVGWEAKAVGPPCRHRPPSIGHRP